MREPSSSKHFNSAQGRVAFWATSKAILKVTRARWKDAALAVCLTYVDEDCPDG